MVSLPRWKVQQAVRLLVQSLAFLACQKIKKKKACCAAAGGGVRRVTKSYLRLLDDSNGQNCRNVVFIFIYFFFLYFFYLLYGSADC